MEKIEPPYKQSVRFFVSRLTSLTLASVVFTFFEWRDMAWDISFVPFAVWHVASEDERLGDHGGRLLIV